MLQLINLPSKHKYVSSLIFNC